jgi:hypothetical protein
MKILFPFLAALLLFPALASGQTNWQLCQQCCRTQSDEDLKRMIAPFLSRQCPECRLLSAALCTSLRKEFNGGENILIRYKLTLPDGTSAEHCAKLGRSEWTDWKWSVRLHPPNIGLKPYCAVSR